jgi:hypothetical protein
MLYAGLKSLRDHHLLVLGVAVTMALLGASWFIGALASPIPLSHAGSRAAAVRRSANTLSVSAGPVAAVVPPQIFEPLTPAQAVLVNAKLPVSPLPNPAARPFKLQGASSTDHALALTCLTMAVYYEAASQGDDGEAAVAQVVLNRVRNPLFPKTVCGVVFQGSTLPTGCQFTFTCDGSLGRRPSQAGWKRAAAVAGRALDGHVESSVGEATHYHTIWVVPYWQPTVVKVAQVGAHLFYRWSGGLGMPAAFQGQYAGGESPPPQIKGFDTGMSPAVLASIGPEQSPAPVAVTPVTAVAELIAPPSPPPAQIAMLTPHLSPALAAKLEAEQKPRGYFGRGEAEGQHLPVPAHW